MPDHEVHDTEVLTYLAYIAHWSWPDGGLGSIRWGGLQILILS